MSRRGIGWVRGRAGVSVVLVTALTTLVAAPAIANGPATIDVVGAQSTAACLTARLCLLGGSNTRRTGDLVSFHIGGRHRSFALSRLRTILDISCPSAAGCVALGYPEGVGFFGLPTTGVAATLTVTDRSGAPTRTARLTLPAGVTLGRVACTSLNQCEVAGLSDFRRPVKVVLGDWNGHRLTLREIAAPVGGTNPTFGGLSCSGSFCELVAYTQKAVRTFGIIVTIHAGRPDGMRFAPGDELNDVSCISASLCYAAARAPAVDWYCG